MKSKKAAMEMSIGTIVTIVLLISFLVLGIFLLQKIFYSAEGAIGMTNEQLTKEIQRLFSDDPDSKVVIIPDGNYLEIKQGKMDDIGIGITNKVEGASAVDAVFAYDLIPLEEDYEDCGITEDVLMDWISREQEVGIQIPIGETYVGRIRIKIPENAPFCTLGFRINAYYDPEGGTQYRSYVPPQTFDLAIV